MILIPLQTYYVTLDLSVSQDPKSQDNFKHDKARKRTGENEDGDHLDVFPDLNQTWANDGVKQGLRNMQRMMDNVNKSKKGPKKENTGSSDEDLGSDDEGQLVKTSEKEVEKRTSSATKAAAAAAVEETDERAEKPSKVQILDLHSTNPIVSYGGVVFACEWTRNIGTEFLFMEHDDQNPLPVLRNLRDDVDLVAASSVRIVAKPLELERISGAQYLDISNNSKDLAPDHIPSEKEKRQDQAEFLSQLNNIKRDKGEDDDVTVITKKQQSESVWQVEWNKKRNQERMALKRILKMKKGTKQAEQAEHRLRELDEADVRRKAHAKKSPSKSSAATRRKKRLNLLLGPSGPSSRPDTRGSKDMVMGTPEVYGHGMEEDDMFDEDAPYDEDDAEMDDGWE